MGWHDVMGAWAGRMFAYGCAGGAPSTSSGKTYHLWERDFGSLECQAFSIGGVPPPETHSPTASPVLSPAPFRLNSALSNRPRFPTNKMKHTSPRKNKSHSTPKGGHSKHGRPGGMEVKGATIRLGGMCVRRLCLCLRALDSSWRGVDGQKIMLCYLPENNFMLNSPYYYYHFFFVLLYGFLIQAKNKNKKSLVRHRRRFLFSFFFLIYRSECSVRAFVRGL